MYDDSDLDQVIEEADDQITFTDQSHQLAPTISSFKKTTGAEFFNKRLKKDSSGSML